jgi:transcriptional regulator with XRE-family HTH domain
MLAPTSATDAGKRLRAARKRLRLSMREVEDLSREIALKMNAPDFFISRTWLWRSRSGKAQTQYLQTSKLEPDL